MESSIDLFGWKDEMLMFDLCGATGGDLFMFFLTAASIKIKLTDRNFVSVCKIIAGDGGVGVWV